MIKYFGEISTIDIVGIQNLKKIPNKFPVFLLATTEEINQYKKLLASASTKGFSLTLRKVCLTLNCHEGLSHEVIYDKLQNLPEIEKEIYDLLKEIPHWNPLMDATTTLGNFLELWKLTEHRTPKDIKILQKDASKKTIKERELQYLD